MRPVSTIDRAHFARGYREGDRDAVAGMPRALVAEEGDEPPVVKAEDSAYYHGYKAAVEGKAVDEASAWAAYVAKHAMSANPLHLKLEGSYSVGIGTQDDKAMRSNAAYDSGWSGPGNYGLTDGEIGQAAARIAGSEELFGRWQRAVESERMATAGEIVADACGAPVRNVDAPALAEVAREIARLRSSKRTKGSTMRANAKGDVIWEDNLLTWVSVGEDKVGDPRGLDMIPTAEGRVAAQDMLEERASASSRVSPLDQEHSFLEAAMGNGWSNVAPQDIGALTDATIVSMDGFIGDDGRWYPHPDVARPVVYAHMNYAVEDPIEMWASGKPVFWMADVLEMTAEQRDRAREELSSAMGESYEANMRGGGTVIESKRWKNARTGATASPYGAVPWSGAPGDTESDWALESVGWTIRWDDGTVGTGQMPDRTREEAQARLARIMKLRPGHRPNARKNILAVIDAFRAHRPYREATCSTDGNTLYSYGLPIASYNRGEVEVLDVAASPSRTTSSQIRAVKAEFPGARTVDSVMHESAYGATGRHVANARRGQKAPAGLTDAEVFFYGQAGYSYPQGASAAEQKRARVEHAKSLARAEAEAAARGWEVEWEHDFDADTSWMDDEARAELERGATEILSALLRDDAGEVLTSLGGVHVRATGRDPYARVVAAEMAQEALAAEDSASRAMALNGGQRRMAQPNWRMMLDLPGVERRLGAPQVAEILARENPAAYASSRAAGWWGANDPEMFEAYKSLARMIEDGELDDLIAETRKRR